MQTLLGQTKLLLAKRGWHKLLGDHRVMEPFTTEEQPGLPSSGSTRLSRAGVPLFGAVLLPEEAYAQLPPAVAEAPAQASAMTYRLFDDPAQARAWLEELA